MTDVRGSLRMERVMRFPPVSTDSVSIIMRCQVPRAPTSDNKDDHKAEQKSPAGHPCKTILPGQAKRTYRHQHSRKGCDPSQLWGPYSFHWFSSIRRDAAVLTLRRFTHGFQITNKTVYRPDGADKKTLDHVCDRHMWPNERGQENKPGHFFKKCCAGEWRLDSYELVQ